MAYDYWAKTKKIVMVPVEVLYHEPTGVVFSVTPPTREECEKALKIQDLLALLVTPTKNV